MMLLTPSEFIDRLYESDNADNIDNMIDFVYEFMDDNFTAGNFVVCNEILEQIDITKLSVHAHLALLTTSSWAKDKLPYRSQFYNSVAALLSQTKLQRLLDGLD